MYQEVEVGGFLRVRDESLPQAEEFSMWE